MKNKMSRREFLKRAALVGGALLVSGGVKQGLDFLEGLNSPGDNLARVWHLNPAYRIREINEDEIKLYTHLGDGRELSHDFRGLEADIFRLLTGEEHIPNHLPALAGKHKLEMEQCEERAGRFLKDYQQAHLIYAGKKMLVKIVKVDRFGNLI